MKKMETPQRSLQKRKKDSNIQTPSQKVKSICNNSQSSTKYNDREKCVSYQDESSIMMSIFKFGEKSVMSILIKNNTYMRYKKFNTHKENIIDLLGYLNPVISLQRTTRKIYPMH